MNTTRPAIYPVLSLRDRAQAVVGYIASGPLADALADLLCQDEITPDRLAEVLIDVHDEIAGTPRPKPRVFSEGSPEPEGVEMVIGQRGFQWKRADRANAKQHYWRRADLGAMGSLVLWTSLNLSQPLTEVLADSEQVRHG